MDKETFLLNADVDEIFSIIHEALMWFNELYGYEFRVTDQEIYKVAVVMRCNIHTKKWLSDLYNYKWPDEVHKNVKAKSKI